MSNDYPSVSIETAGKELDRLHRSIEGKLRSTVDDAIRAGEILTQVKGRLSHGDFLPWLKANCSFAQPTAWRYMKLYQHNDKLSSLNNLQEAYQQIETIERQEKLTETQKAKQRVIEYRKTGVKPEGWRRGTDDKIAQAEEERRRRVEEQIARLKKEEEEQKKREEERERLRREHEENMRRINATTDFFNGLNEQVLVESKKRQTFKERIRISAEGENDPFIDALIGLSGRAPRRQPSN
jgi:vacuolar-type H+-ATPase subunit I/STV1